MANLARLSGLPTSDGLALRLLQDSLLEGEHIAYSLKLLAGRMADGPHARWIASAAEDAELLEGVY